MQTENVTQDALEKIFDMQKKLIAEYTIIEGLPYYPIDPLDHAGKRLIKDFKERAVAELGEAYEKLLEIWINESNNESYDKIAALEAFNEEIADVMHFLIETLIFCNIEPLHIAKFLQDIADENPESFIKPDNLWLTLFSFAKHQNLSQNLSYQNINKTQCFRVIDDSVLITQRADIAGGRIVSGSMMATHAEFMWEITFMLNKAVAYLKIKPWAQEEKIGNGMKFRECMMETLMHFIRYMDFMGQNPIGLYNAYVRKNKILQKRIQDGY
jgi:hypothetical protein